MRTAPIYPPGWRPYAPPAPATAPAAIPTAGQRLALAISSLAFFWLMIALSIGAAQVFGVGFGGWLFAVILVGLITIVVNVLFSFDLFRTRR
jgi:hypothetical protein